MSFEPAAFDREIQVLAQVEKALYEFDYATFQRMVHWLCDRRRQHEGQNHPPGGSVNKPAETEVKS